MGLSERSFERAFRCVFNLFKRLLPIILEERQRTTSAYTKKTKQNIFKPLKAMNEGYRVQLDEKVNDKDVSGAFIGNQLSREALFVSMRTLDTSLSWRWRKSQALTLAGIHESFGWTAW
jgi:hypothetical protein